MGTLAKLEEHKDGSATLTLDLTKEESEILVGEGVKFLLCCTAGQISPEKALELIAKGNLSD